MTKQTNEQTRTLRIRLLGKMALSLAVWSAIFILICALFEIFVSNDLGDWIANQTSKWVYSSELVDASEAADPAGDIEKGIDEFYALYDTMEKDKQQNVQMVVMADGSLALRDLSTYNFFRSLKIPLAVAVFAIGVIVIIVRTLNRSLSYFSDLASALSDPHLVEGGDVELPKELTIASQQIKLMQKKIHDHEQVAVMAEQRKNELVAYLAHDIRTPLTSVVGYLSLLAESPDLPREKRAEFAGIALAKAERLETLVEEFFEITRYNLDAILLERENVDVALFLEQVADEFGIAAQDRAIRITTQAPEKEQVFIDPSKMARAVGNIVKNAISYADPESEVALSAAVDETEMVIATSNQGREISPVHLEAVFERFYREDGARGQGANAGLGLAIAREIVEAHGGSIVAESSDGLTTFTIRIPR